ncbi:hypothetical protein NECAME_17064, partial [Necator americanus]
HTGSWRGQPELLTECFDSAGKPTNLPNLIDPSNEENFKFLEEFLNEVVETFPDEFLHLGGDEIEDFIVECWKVASSDQVVFRERNPKIRDFMQKKSFGNDTTLLEDFFFERYLNYIKYGADWRDEIPGTAPSNSRLGKLVGFPAESKHSVSNSGCPRHEPVCPGMTYKS